MEPMTIVTSIVVTLVTTFIIQRFQKRMEFLYDYRKYILEKRKAAYEKIEYVISHKAIFDRLNKSNGFENMEDNIKEYKSLIQAAQLNNVWLTTAIHETLTSLNRMLFYMVSAVNRHRLDRYEYFNSAVTILESELVSQYFTDVIELDNIQKFKKQNKVTLDKKMLSVYEESKTSGNDE